MKDQLHAREEYGFEWRPQLGSGVYVDIRIALGNDIDPPWREVQTSIKDKLAEVADQCQK